MDEKKIASIVDQLWVIRGSYLAEERADQKNAWEDIFAQLESEKKVLTAV